jgi:hypothetical protein
MEKKIIVHKSPSADTRSANHIITKDELEKSTAMHISDVAKAMHWFAEKLEEAGENHDWTKNEYLDEFYEQFHREQETGHGDWGENPDGWYRKIHLVKERHHLSNGCPEDVDLFDVLEQIADGVMAGMARSGKYRQEPISKDMLEKAYRNTVAKLLGVIELKD